MSAHPQSLGHRIMATGIAAALALTGVITAAGVANADSPEFGNIDKDATGSLTLHKRESGSIGTNGSVFEKTDSGTPVGGVTFTYFPITGLNLKDKQADWADLAKLQVSEDACDSLAAGQAGLTLAANKTGALNKQLSLGIGEAMVATDDRTGDTTKAGLGVGAYLVCETARPATVKKAAAPFVATIPTPKPNKGWTYDVHAYPKNTVIQPATKSLPKGVGDDILPPAGLGLNTADQVTFTIRAKVPQLSKKSDGQGAKDEYFKYFILGDSLPAGYSEGKIASVNLADDATAPGVAIANDAPIRFTKTDSGSPVAGDKKHWLSVSFTRDGLAYLKDQPNKYVVVTVTAKVSAVTSGKNHANKGYFITDTETVPPTQTPPEVPFTPPLNPGEPPKSNTPGEPPYVPTNEVVTTWGQAKFKKQGKDAAHTGLEGAVFEIYEAATQDAACTGKDTKGQAISVGGHTTFTSKGDGEVLVDGLYVGAGEQKGASDTVAAPAHRCYVFKEIAAPAGYVLPAGDEAKFAVKVEPGQMTSGKYTFENTQITVPELPLTGASGTVIATVVGTSLLLLAVGAVLVRRRREAEID